MVASTTEVESSNIMSISSYVSIKLTMTDSLLWKTQIWSLIEGEDLMGFIDGISQEPEEFLEKDFSIKPAYIKWRKRDRLFKSWTHG